MSDKHARLRELALRRKMSRWPGYKCIGDYHHGVYECPFVSPYTIGADNVDADVMVLLQDWASDEVLRGPVVPERITLGHDPDRRTTPRLKELLWQYLELKLEQVYATNVFPFVKPGVQKASIKRRDLVRAAQEFALPQIEIVRPRLAVCLGLATFNAVVVAAGGRRAKRMRDAMAASPFRFGETQVWCQAHTGRQGTNSRNRGGVDRVSEDWARMVSGGVVRRRRRSR